MYYKQLDKTTWRCVGEASKHPVTGKRKQISLRGKTKKRRIFILNDSFRLFFG